MVWWPGADPDAVGRVTVACYDPADISGEHPLVVFPTLPPYPASEGTSPGRLLGEVGLNATCCVLLHDKLLWPTYNPVTHAWHPPPHDRPPTDHFSVAYKAVLVAAVPALLIAVLFEVPVIADPRGLILIALVLALIVQRVSARRRRSRLRRAAPHSPPALPPADT